MQIRLSPRDKRRIEAHAKRAGMSVSAWVLGRALPASTGAFDKLCRRLAATSNPGFVYAELNDFLSNLTASEFTASVEHRPAAALDAQKLNYVAAMLEQAAVQLDVAPPAWTKGVPPLADPVFATELTSLRLHLLVRGLPSFRRRNIFADSGVGARV